MSTRQRSVLVVSRSRDIIRGFFAGYSYYVTATGPDGFQVSVTSQHSSKNNLIGDFLTLAAAELFAARMRALDLGEYFYQLAVGVRLLMPAMHPGVFDQGCVPGVRCCRRRVSPLSNGERSVGG